jgi:hypothetical protein
VPRRDIDAGDAVRILSAGVADMNEKAVHTRSLPLRGRGGKRNPPKQKRRRKAPLSFS